MRKITMIFIGGLTALIAAFDIWVINQGGKEASISHVLIEWAYEYPSLPFLLGFVCGHLFWRMKTTDLMKKKGIG